MQFLTTQEIQKLPKEVKDMGHTPNILGDQ